MSNPAVLMLKELLRSVEAGEVTIVDCNLSSETEETTIDMDGGPTDTSTKLTGKVDWWFTTQLGDKSLKASLDRSALERAFRYSPSWASYPNRSLGKLRGSALYRRDHAEWLINYWRQNKPSLSVILKWFDSAMDGLNNEITNATEHEALRDLMFTKERLRQVIAEAQR